MPDPEVHFFFSFELVCSDCRTPKDVSAASHRTKGGWSCIVCRNCRAKHKASKWLCACNRPWTTCKSHFKEGLRCKATKKDPKRIRPCRLNGPRYNQNVGFLGMPQIPPKLNMLERVRQAMHDRPKAQSWHKTRPKPRMTCNSTKVHREPTLSKSNNFAGSKVLAALLQEGIAKQDQLDERMDHLQAANRDCKRSWRSNTEDGPPEHRAKQLESKPSRDA